MMLSIHFFYKKEKTLGYWDSFGKHLKDNENLCPSLLGHLGNAGRDR